MITCIFVNALQELQEVMPYVLVENDCVVSQEIIDHVLYVVLHQRADLWPKVSDQIQIATENKADCRSFERCGFRLFHKLYEHFM